MTAERFEGDQIRKKSCRDSKRLRDRLKKDEKLSVSRGHQESSIERLIFQTKSRNTGHCKGFFLRVPMPEGFLRTVALEGAAAGSTSF